MQVLHPSTYPDFIPDMVGRLYQQFAVTIAISVLISAFVALSLTPALCTLILRSMHLDAQSKGLYKFFYRFSGWFARLTGFYTGGMRRSIRAAHDCLFTCPTRV